jgi:hypothetical protein
MNLKINHFRKLLVLLFCFIILAPQIHAQQPDITIRKKDRKKDIEMVITEGSSGCACLIQPPFTGIIS